MKPASISPNLTPELRTISALVEFSQLPAQEEGRAPPKKLLGLMRLPQGEEYLQIFDKSTVSYVECAFSQLGCSGLNLRSIVDFINANCKSLFTVGNVRTAQEWGALQNTVQDLNRRVMRYNDGRYLSYYVSIFRIPSIAAIVIPAALADKNNVLAAASRPNNNQPPPSPSGCSLLSAKVDNEYMTTASAFRAAQSDADYKQS